MSEKRDASPAGYRQPPLPVLPSDATASAYRLRMRSDHESITAATKSKSFWQQGIEAAPPGGRSGAADRRSNQLV